MIRFVKHWLFTFRIVYDNIFYGYIIVLTGFCCAAGCGQKDGGCSKSPDAGNHRIQWNTVKGSHMIQWTTG